jgi:hypothetical protein
MNKIALSDMALLSLRSTASEGLPGYPRLSNRSFTCNIEAASRFAISRPPLNPPPGKPGPNLQNALSGSETLGIRVREAQAQAPEKMVPTDRSWQAIVTQCDQGVDCLTSNSR